MLELEDLPRLESLSPIKDVEEGYQHCETNMTKLMMTNITPIPTSGNMTKETNNLCQNSSGTNKLNFIEKITPPVLDFDQNLDMNQESSRMILGGGLRYISQVSRQISNITKNKYENKENCNFTRSFVRVPASRKPVLIFLYIRIVSRSVLLYFLYYIAHTDIPFF